MSAVVLHEKPPASGVSGIDGWKFSGRVPLLVLERRFACSSREDAHLQRSIAPPVNRRPRFIPLETRTAIFLHGRRFDQPTVAKQKRPARYSDECLNSLPPAVDQAVHPRCEIHEAVSTDAGPSGIGRLVTSPEIPIRTLPARRATDIDATRSARQQQPHFFGKQPNSLPEMQSAKRTNFNTL